MAWAARLEMCPDGGLPKPGSAMNLPMSRGDLADYLGLTIETVSRSLSLLRRQGLIGLDHAHEISLIKPGRLEQIANALA